MLCSITDLPAIDQIVITFRTAFEEKPIVAVGDECLDAKFMTEREIVGLPVAWASVIGNSPQRFFDQLRSGMYSIELHTVEVDTSACEESASSVPPFETLVY
jgi:hypothetical protein